MHKTYLLIYKLNFNYELKKDLKKRFEAEARLAAGLLIENRVTHPSYIDL